MSESRNCFVGKIVSGDWKIIKFLAAGSFGSVYTVRRICGPIRRGVVKLEHCGLRSVKREAKVLLRLQGLTGFPKMYTSGIFRTESDMYTNEDIPVIVMQELGCTVELLMESYRFSVSDVLKLGIQMLERLRDMHTRGFLHRDIQGGNILIGNQRDGEAGKIYLIDFKSSIAVNKSTQSHKYGNVLFQSDAALQMKKYGRKDDLESLVYLLVYLYTRKLPWSKFQSSEQAESKFIKKCLTMRLSMSSLHICDGLPCIIARILRDLRQMSYNDIPNYETYIHHMKLSLSKRGFSENDKFSWE